MLLEWVKTSLSIAFICCIFSCERKSRAKLYLASSLISIADEIKSNASIDVDLEFLTSSSIAHHMLAAAPCEMAIFADEQWSNVVTKKKIATLASTSIASNSLVIASRSLTTQKKNNDVISLFADIDHAKKIIIGDPDYVPLGVYTKEVLEHYGLYAKLAPRLLRAHSARHATILLKHSDDGTLAILYASDAMSENFTIETTINSNVHRPISYPLVICQTAKMDLVEKLQPIFSSPKFLEALVIKGYRSHNYAR